MGGCGNCCLGGWESSPFHALECQTNNRVELKMPISVVVKVVDKDLFWGGIPSMYWMECRGGHTLGTMTCGAQV